MDLESDTHVTATEGSRMKPTISKHDPQTSFKHITKAMTILLILSITEGRNTTTVRPVAHPCLLDNTTLPGSTAQSGRRAIHNISSSPPTSTHWTGAFLQTRKLKMSAEIQVGSNLSPSHPRCGETVSQVCTISMSRSSCHVGTISKFVIL